MLNTIVNNIIKTYYQKKVLIFVYVYGILVNFLKIYLLLGLFLVSSKVSSNLNGILKPQNPQNVNSEPQRTVLECYLTKRT